MRASYYDRQGTPCDLMTWAEEFENNRVALTDVKGYRVSTVFLGIDHNYTNEGPPIIFETMIFGDGDLDEWCERYATEAEALEGHEKAIDMVNSTLCE